jgi:hypothetical protein
MTLIPRLWIATQMLVNANPAEAILPIVLSCLC